MKVLGLVMMGLLLVYAFFGLQDVRADEADEAYKTGLKYYNGEGVSQNHTEALRWFRKAADQGNADAQLNIRSMYANGEGITQNYRETVKWNYNPSVPVGQNLRNKAVGCPGGF
jgi:TPR repeat protein